MKILAVDDQQLVLLPLEKRLKERGYEVKTTTDAQNALSLFKSYQPDLLIIDINMAPSNGLEIVRSIRKDLGDNTPIMVLSGNTDDQLIVEAYEIGIQDFMKKPLSLDEITARVARLIGCNHEKCIPEVTTNSIILNHCVGVVIPCYNEEKRLKSEEFIGFIEKNSGYHLCFVNDGSTDNTLTVLQNLRNGREDHISIFNCEKNGGKAEAVRQGLIYMSQFQDLDYIGFLDADLSTDFQDFEDLVKTIETTDFQIVNGSRISRMGAMITKESARKIISMSINLLITTILGMPFKDTQCGAKIMRKELIPVAFSSPFLTRWLFDVEIFMRMKKYFGKHQAQEMICEQPLKRWIHADGSKLSMKDSAQIGFQLFKIYWSYNFKKFNAKKMDLKQVTT
ncbi:response regulator [Robertkochia marina]|uniref:dolichyl-phosphate beta-glucosyltransferase n=1 Tax=Robertkochia marina TaxID=1227945 RepID=A0A4S3LZP2_9FLAO|nr:response regulator [Robertkochia marina]THD67592.1 response regulator [Robertkochia marina]TRZ44539.1 response regulator [Robertkochia marina]